MPLTQTVTRGSGSNAMRPTIPEDNTKFTAAGAQRERVPKNNCSQRVKTRLNIASGADQGNWNRTQTRIETVTEAVPLLPPRKTLPAGTTIRLPEGGSLKHKQTARGGLTPQEPNAARSRRQTPRRNRAGGTHCRSHWTPASHNAISPLTPGLAQPPRPKPDSIPLAGGPLPFWRAPANSQGSFCAAARS